MYYDRFQSRCGEASVCAVKGDKFDGHDFIEKAWENGAECVLSEKEFIVPHGKSLILVENTRKALLDLAEGYRSLLEAYPLFR